MYRFLIYFQYGFVKKFLKKITWIFTNKKIFDLEDENKFLFGPVPSPCKTLARSLKVSTSRRGARVDKAFQGGRDRKMVVGLNNNKINRRYRIDEPIEII